MSRKSHAWGVFWVLFNAFMAGLLWRDGSPIIVAANAIVAVVCAGALVTSRVRGES